MKDALDRCNVVWTSPSKDYNGSMPIGNGDIGANVWVEPTGDLIFYLSKTDAWSGGGPDPELLKLGRFRVRLDKPLFQEGATFRQELDLKTGSITINATTDENKRSIRFWIDANRPVVHLDIQSSPPCTAEIALESWRAEGKYLRGGSQKDIILPADGQTVRWYQRNVHSIFKDNMKNQHMGDVVDQFSDPLIHRTFGGVISGKGLKSKDDKTLATTDPVENIEIQIHPLTAQTKTADEWLLQLEEQRKTVDAAPKSEAWEAHVKWWQSFWQRSWIDVTQSTEPVKKEIPSLIPSNDLNFRIGVTKGNHEKFQGEVGRVSILNRALTEPEIKSLADNKTQINGLTLSQKLSGFLSNRQGRSIKLIRDLWERQRGCCYYSNIPMSWGHIEKDDWTVSVERLNQGSYTPDNTVLVCAEFNSTEYRTDRFEHLFDGKPQGWNRDVVNWYRTRE